MQTVTSGTVHLHVKDEGPRDGRVVMFGNSLGTDFRVWDLMLPHLPGGLRIVRFDKRGHGLSDCPPAPYAMDDLVGDTLAIVDALDLRDITFVGLSIGGMIGQGIAARRPDLLRALVLMDTAAKIGTPALWDDRIATVRSKGLSAMSDGIMQRWFSDAFRADAPRLAPWVNMLTRTPAEGYAGCSAAISGADLTETTKQITLPVMAIGGSEDGSTPPDVVRATADLCGAPFHLIEGAGHIPCVEAPEETAALIADFLERT